VAIESLNLKWCNVRNIARLFYPHRNHTTVSHVLVQATQNLPLLCVPNWDDIKGSIITADPKYVLDFCIVKSPNRHRSQM